VDADSYIVALVDVPVETLYALPSADSSINVKSASVVVPASVEVIDCSSCASCCSVQVVFDGGAVAPPPLQDNDDARQKSRSAQIALLTLFLLVIKDGGIKLQSTIAD